MGTTKKKKTNKRYHFSPICLYLHRDTGDRGIAVQLPVMMGFESDQETAVTLLLHVLEIKQNLKLANYGNVVRFVCSFVHD